MQGEQLVSKIKSLAADRRILMKNLYAACGSTASAVSQWKTGKTTPTMDALDRIAEQLHITTAELLEEDNKKPTPVTGSGSKRDTLLSIVGQLSEENLGQLLSYAEFLANSGQK